MGWLPDPPTGLPTASTKGDIAVFDGSDWVVLAAGTDTHVLTADSGETEGIKWAAASGGGGGKSYVTDPNLKPPDSADAADVEFLDYANGDDPESDAGMTWLNQGTVTADIQGGRLVVHVPPGKTDRAALVTAVPGSGDFDFTIRHRTFSSFQWHAGGSWICNDSPAGTFANYRYFVQNIYADSVWRIIPISSGWAAAGGNLANINREEGMWTDQGAVYERWVWDDTASTLTWQFTPDPLAGWISRYTSGSINRPTFAGYGISGESSASTNQDLLASVDFIRFNWTPDFDPTTDD